MQFEWQLVTGVHNFASAQAAIPSGWRFPKRSELLIGIEEGSLTESDLYWSCDELPGGVHAWAIVTQNSYLKWAPKAMPLKCIAVKDAAQ